jgi:hypothetical protein
MLHNLPKSQVGLLARFLPSPRARDGALTTASHHPPVRHRHRWLGLTLGVGWGLMRGGHHVLPVVGKSFHKTL